MAKTPPTLLQEIEAFLDASGMGASYFGRRATGNSELVSRLRDGGRVWPETESKVRAFLIAERSAVRKGGYVGASRARQDNPAQKGKSEGAR